MYVYIYIYIYVRSARLTSGCRRGVGLVFDLGLWCGILAGRLAVTFPLTHLAPPNLRLTSPRLTKGSLT